MGRIVCQVTVRNATEPSQSIRFDAMVDTGASHLVLPAKWKERLGELRQTERVVLQLTNKGTVEGEIFGPIEVEIEGFRPVFTEALFVPMQESDGSYEALVGYTVLEMIPAAVDMVGHRLVHAGALDLK
jgi:predicted aspartyl protease